MNSKKQKLLKIPKKFTEFVSGLEKNDRIAIYFDGDADGLCAGAIIFRAIAKIMGKNPELVFTQGKGKPFIEKETIQMLKKNRINKFICVDVSLDQQPKRIKECEKAVERILVLDHHKKYNNLNSKKTLMLKVQDLHELDGAAYPSAKFSFDLFSSIAGLSDVSWIASAGIIGDNGLRHWKKFVEKACKTHKTSIKELTELKEIISAVEVFEPEKMNELVLEVVKAKNPKQIIKGKYGKTAKKLEKELNELIKKFHKEKELIPALDLVFFEFGGKTRIKSVLANRVSNEFYPHKTVFIFQKKGKEVLISARRQDYKVKVNDLIEKCVKGLKNASGGGHIPAAAGRIRAKDLEKFKEKVKKELKTELIK